MSKNYLTDRNCRKHSADHGKHPYDCLRFTKNYFVAVIKNFVSRKNNTVLSIYALHCMVDGRQALFYLSPLPLFDRFSGALLLEIPAEPHTDYQVLHWDSIMFTGRQKIVKANGAEPDEFEASVAQELFNLEVKLGIDRIRRAILYSRYFQ